MYALIEDYQKKYNSITDEDNIVMYLELAMFKINQATLTRIEKMGFENLTQKQQELIKKATVEQCEYIYTSGVLEDDEVVNYNVGDVSFSLERGQSIAEKMLLSKRAYIYLQQTGLMGRML